MFWMNNVVIWYQKVEEWINEYKQGLTSSFFYKRMKLYIPKEWALDIITEKEWNLLKREAEEE